MTKEKQLRKTNRILSLLVVALALGTGYLFSDKMGWLNPKTPEKPRDVPVREITSPNNHLKLIEPAGIIPKSLHEALSRNQFNHSLSDESLSQKQVAALLWSAQGIISQWGDRTAPSYRSAYPIELRVVARNLEGIKAGVYRYVPDSHSLEVISASGSGGLHFANEPPSMAKAPMVITMSAKNSLPQNEFEAGQIAENILLAAKSINLGTTLVKSLEENWSLQLGLAQNQALIVVMPIGVPYDSQVSKVSPKPTIK